MTRLDRRPFSYFLAVYAQQPLAGDCKSPLRLRALHTRDSKNRREIQGLKAYFEKMTLFRQAAIFRLLGMPGQWELDYGIVLREGSLADSELQRVDENWERALAVVAHPDDLEYGAASAIARWISQGKTVSYLLLTRGQAGIDGMTPEVAGPIRAREEQASGKAVGVNVVEFLDYEDGCIEYGLPLRQAIARSIRQHRPQVLISTNFRLTWGGTYLNMADHRHAGLAVLDGARDAANRWIFPELVKEGLEPWKDAHTVLFLGSPEAAHGVDVTDYLDKGIASLREHKAYIEGLGQEFDVDKFLREGAEAVGKRMGVKYGVSFELFNV